MSWLSGPAGINRLDVSASTFRRRTAWCWNVTPTIVPTGEIHHQIMLDGTYFNGWCVLIAHTGCHVIDWQWCDREKLASWTALLARIPAPAYAIVDGNGPLRKALKNCWPDTKIQRCFFHIRNAAHRHLTRTPKLPANQQLLALYKALSTVSSLDEAAAWTASFLSWEATWQTFLNHRTYAGKNTPRPAHANPNQKWWHTHIRTRRAHKLITGLLADNELFTWLDPDAPKPVAATTNPLEGGPNKAIKDFLRHHRGLTADHARRGVDWLLYQHTEHPRDPWSFVTEAHWNPPRTRPQAPTDEPIGPAAYDTAVSYEDGIGIQQGWAGRHH